MVTGLLRIFFDIHVFHQSPIEIAGNALNVVHIVLLIYFCRREAEVAKSDISQAQVSSVNLVKSFIIKIFAQALLRMLIDLIAA